MNNKAKVFEFLYKKHGESYNINQISRLIGISVGSAFKVLKDLEDLGYVGVNKKNNALLYQINISNKSKELYEKIEEEENRKSKKRTKVICTIGSASNPAVIKKMIEKGMDVARIDVSDLDDKRADNLVQNIRHASDEMPILLDIGAKSRHWINFALKKDLDFVAIAATNGEDIQQINRLLGYSNIKQVIGDKIKVIAKIGKDSLKNYKEIIEESYGVVIDRRKLSNTKIEMLPKLQKEIIDECNKFGKPVIIAGNVLGSMTENKQPMQSEIYDIYNAILEGVSCLMLVEETAIGAYPLLAVEVISKIIKGAETGQLEGKYASYDLTHFIGNAISDLEKNLRIDALLIITSGGYSARMISSKRLKCKTIAATSRKKIFRQLHLLWGIEPLYVDINTEDISNIDKKEVILKALKKGFIGKKDQIAIIASIFHSKCKRTNLLEIHNVSEFLDYLNKNKELDLEV